MHSYLGSLEAINDPRNAALKRSNCEIHSPKQQLKKKHQHLKNLQSRDRSDPRQKCEGIDVNVSGKCFSISLQNLKKYPKSLLSDAKKRERYFDSKKTEYFFDHNRIVAESVCLFYQYGHLVKPPNIPEQLFADELLFFGIYDYLDVEDKKKFVGPEPKISQFDQSQNTFRKNIWVLLEKPEANIIARIYNLFSLAIIILSVFLLCVDTYKQDESAANNTSSSVASIRKSDIRSQNTFSWIFISETVCIGFFTLELMTRFLVSWDKPRFLKNFLNVVDFVAIIPFYASLVLDLHRLGVSISVLRVIRLGKIFRVLKISRYTSSLQILVKTVSSGRWDLWMLLFLFAIQALFFASVAYYFEQIWAEDDTEFTSIPAALWWAVITSLTIGYGDMIPKSFGE
jgi:hypothetical protein